MGAGGILIAKAQLAFAGVVIAVLTVSLLMLGPALNSGAGSNRESVGHRASIVTGPGIGHVHLLPAASGTLRYFPELGILDRAPIGDDVVSDFFKTTAENREFRRGFLEFDIPDYPYEIVEATLVLVEERAWIGEPLPPDVHELSHYPADLAVNTEDYNRSTTFLDSFETDVNEDPGIFYFNITDLVLASEGERVGFRVKLEVDPTYDEFTSIGSGFAGLSSGWPSRIVVAVIDEVPPVADAGDDQTVGMGRNVTFNGSDSSDNLGVVNYTWTFADPTEVTLYGATAQYAFNRTGVYEVNLTVRDQAGNVDSDILLIKVEKEGGIISAETALVISLGVIAGLMAVIAALLVLLRGAKAKHP